MSSDLDLSCKNHTPPPRNTPPPGCAAQQGIARQIVVERVEMWITAAQGAGVSATGGASGEEIAPYRSSGRTANPAHCHYCQFFLGPTSTCCQSIGMPDSRTGPPPPHLNPWTSVIRPQMAFMKFVGSTPRETSTPVAGQLLCVLRLSRAVGRP